MGNILTGLLIIFFGMAGIFVVFISRKRVVNKDPCFDDLANKVNSKKLEEAKAYNDHR